MHARMLLPTTFMVLLPVSVVTVHARGWWLAGIVLVWAVVCAGWMRPPYSTALPTGFSAAAAPDPYDPDTGIADERLFWVRSSGTAYPVTVDDYIPRNMFALEGARVRGPRRRWIPGPPAPPGRQHAISGSSPRGWMRRSW